jgi:hypothetical protein
VLERKKLKVQVKGSDPILEGELFDEIAKDDSSWTIGTSGLWRCDADIRQRGDEHRVGEVLVSPCVMSGTGPNSQGTHKVTSVVASRPDASPQARHYKDSA